MPKKHGKLKEVYLNRQGEAQLSVWLPAKWVDGVWKFIEKNSDGIRPMKMKTLVYDAITKEMAEANKQKEKTEV